MTHVAPAIHAYCTPTPVIDLAVGLLQAFGPVRATSARGISSAPLLLPEKPVRMTLRLPSAITILLVLPVLAQPASTQGAGNAQTVRETSRMLGPGVVQQSGPGQRQAAGWGNYRGKFHTITPGAGLPDGTVQDILQDRDGSLWFATLNGVARYDGQESISYSQSDGLCGNEVGSLAQDGEGVIWFGCGRRLSRRGGLTRYDGEFFTTYTDGDGLGYGYVWDLQPSRDGGLWILSHEGDDLFVAGHPITRLQKLTENRIQTYDVGSSMLAMVEAPDGTLWVGGYDVVMRLQKGPQDVAVHAVPSATHLGRVHGMALAADGAVWVAADSGAFRQDGDTLRVVVETAQLLPHHPDWENSVLALAPGTSGDMWLGTDNGIVHLAYGGVARFTEADGLPDHRIGTLLVDRAGDLWAGTGGWNQGGNGLARYVGNVIASYSTAEGMPVQQVMAIGQGADGDHWFGTWGGVGRLHGEMLHSVESMGHSQSMVRDQQGDLWVGARGIFRCRGAECQLALSAPPGIGTRRKNGFALVEAQGLVWASSMWPETTLYRLDAGAFEPVQRGVSLAGVDRDGTVWVNESKGTVLADVEGLQSTRSLGLDFVSEDTRIFGDSDGTLWVHGFGLGLIRYADGQAQRLTAADGLPHMNVLHVMEDRRGRLWFALWGRGVAVYDGLVFQSMTDADGLPHDAAQMTFEDRDGDIWIATEGGATRYRPGTDRPGVHIRGVTTNRQLGPVARVQMTTAQTEIRFDYHGTSFRTRPGRLAYAYRLVGLHDDWRTTRQNFVTYQDLGRGDYVFEVRAVDRDLNRSIVASVQLSVDWPYDRYSMWTALVLALGGIAVLGLRLTRSARSLQRSNVELEVAREKAESASLAKSQFLANISHEIRTPMNAILGYAQLLRHEDLEGSQLRDVESIHRAGTHLLRVINEVLDLSKIEAGQLQLHSAPFDLDELMASLASDFSCRCEEKGLAWELTWAGGATSVVGDASKLTQVLINLLGNAVKFTDSGGVSLLVVAGIDGRCHFEVRDTGIGMSVHEQSTLFQPFQQGPSGEERGGTGLGLTIARQLVGLMGGQLQVSSSAGAGSRLAFNIELPPGVAAPSLRAPEDTRYRILADRSVRALVADDVEDNRLILQRVLQDMGIQVELAVDGGEALRRIVNETFDIAFLDIRMPVLDGRDVVRQIREREIRLPLVAISASVLEHEQATFRAAGFNDFIGKPFELSRLAECLRTQLHLDLQTLSARMTTEPGPADDLVTTVIPEELHARLLAAARWSRVTALEEALQELEQLGPSQRQLVDRVRVLRRSFDTDGITQLLMELPTHA